MSDAPDEIGLVGNGLEWRLWNRYEDRNEQYAVRYILRDKHEDEVAALKKQVEELTKALNRKVDEKCAAVQARTRAEAEVAALRKERDRLNGCLNLANERTDENFDQAVKNAFSAVKLRRENELLRKALEFYADVSKYPAPLTGGMGDLWADCGRIARAALEAAGGRG